MFYALLCINSVQPSASQQFVQERVLCPETQQYISSKLTQNKVCVAPFPSVGNWGIQLLLQAQFAWTFNAGLVFDLTKWPLLPYVLQRNILDPYSDPNCLSNPPLNHGNGTKLFLLKNGWILLETDYLKLNNFNVVASEIAEKRSNTNTLSLKMDIRSFFPILKDRRVIVYQGDPHLCKINALFKWSKKVLSLSVQKQHYLAMHIRTPTALDLDTKHYNCTNGRKKGCTHLLYGSESTLCKHWIKQSSSILSKLQRFMDKKSYIVVSPSFKVKKECAFQLGKRTNFLPQYNQVDAHTQNDSHAIFMAFADLHTLVNADVLICGRSSFCWFARQIAFDNLVSKCTSFKNGVYCQHLKV